MAHPFETHSKIIHFGGGLPPRRAGRVAGRRPEAAQAGAGGEARRQSPAGASGRAANATCLLFYKSKWPYHSKINGKFTHFEGWGNPSRGHGGNPPRGHGGNPPRGRGGNPPRGRQGAMAPPTVAGQRIMILILT